MRRLCWLYFRRKDWGLVEAAAGCLTCALFGWPINLTDYARFVGGWPSWINPDNVEFLVILRSGFPGSHVWSGCFLFLRPMRNRSDLLSWKPLASENVVLRYFQFIREYSAELCHNVDEFVPVFAKYLDKKVDKREAGQVAKSRSIGRCCRSVS